MYDNQQITYRHAYMVRLQIQSIGLNNEKKKMFK